MLRPTISIKLYPQSEQVVRTIYFVEALKIESGWEFLCDKAEFSLPRKLFANNTLVTLSTDNDVYRFIKIGDKIEVYLGYDYDEQIVYSGFISSIKPGLKVTISCEDRMWQLKRRTVSESWSQVSLKQYLSAVLPEGQVPILEGDIQLGKIRLDRATSYQALEYLKNTYGLYSWYDTDGNFYCGFPYFNAGDKATLIEWHKSVHNDSQLEWQRADEVKIKVKAIITNADGSTVEKIVGDADGEEHTMHLPIGTSVKDIERVATERLKKWKFDGYRGTLGIIGKPNVYHSTKSKLANELYPERDGQYFIDAVTTTFDNNGLKRSVKIGRSI